MEDSFFGFDTSAPLEEDGGGRIAEPSEEEYDALNDETFGSAINGDWEEVHENLVRMNDNVNGSDGEVTDEKANNSTATFKTTFARTSTSSSQSHSHRNKNEVDSDLEINLSGMRLDDVDIAFGDNESGINLDPSVWANPVNSSAGTLEQEKSQSIRYSNREEFLREQFPSSFQSQLQQQKQQQLQQQKQKQEQQLQQQQQRQKQDAFFMGIQQQQKQPHNQQDTSMQSGAPKICTLEDIERSIIIQQTMQKQQKQQHQQQQQQRQADTNSQSSQVISSTPKSKTSTSTKQQQQQQHQSLYQQQGKQPAPTTIKGGTNFYANPIFPPGFATGPQRHNNFNNSVGPHTLGTTAAGATPIGGGVGTAQHRMPPGFPSLPMYPPGITPGGHMHHQQPHPINHPHNQQQLQNFPRPMANLPIALNNFAMHPNFNAMRPVHGPPLVPPRMPPHPNLMNHNVSPGASMFNMFNMRLVQEIQQNHPMLNARHSSNTSNSNGCNNNFNLPLSSSSSLGSGLNNIHHISNSNNLQQLQHQYQQQMRGKQNHPLHHMQHQQPYHQQHMQHQQNHLGGGLGPGQQQQQQQLQHLRANGNLPDEYDEYANLMSTRDKHWLIAIQLSQLNTDTPYIDDYYYTVFKERKAMLNGDSGQSKTHKDNQLNHPLTQPKGHAQLILVQLGNKNGTNTRNGQNNRERRNSETNKSNDHHHDQQRKYVFTPLKFENSLGKLQYGSVTAPRKIIDMDIMGSDGNVSGGTLMSGSNASSSMGGTVIELSVQRKSRHILLHIETLYRIVLKLEDLENPDAIATFITKKKKETERIMALEQMETMNKTAEERAAEAANPPAAINPALKNRFVYDLEPKEALLATLIAGLTQDKIIAMMNVRKGKSLIRRMMVHIQDNPIRWNVWLGVFTSLQYVLKKDRDDVDGLLYALYPEFKKQIKMADFDIVVKLSCSIPLTDKKANGLFCSKFGISSLVCLILQAEQIYVVNADTTLNDLLKESWRQFLDLAATSLKRTIQNQSICAAIESDSIQPMMDHFARFKDLELDSLLALISQAKRQIN